MGLTFYYHSCFCLPFRRGTASHLDIRSESNMPFAIIETTNAKGQTELSIVPGRWLRSSKNGSIVLLPSDSNSASEKETYFRDESACPQSWWQKSKCAVKRHPISSYERAKSVLDVMSAESTSDAKHLGDRQRSDQEANTHQQPGDGENMIPSKSAWNASLTKNQTTAEPKTIKIENDSLPVIVSAFSTTKPDNIEPSHASKFPPPSDSMMQKCLEKMNEILGLQHLLNARMDQLEQKITVVSEQNRLILNSTNNCCKHSKIEETLSFHFDPMDNEQQLAELEKNLDDATFKEKLIKWLRLNVSGDCSEDRMLGVLDALFSKKFQTMCTWTGASRKGPKTAVMPNRNILEIFQIIGSGDSDLVNQRELANFFMKKLKNSLKRLHVSGVRRATRHVRRRKTELPEQANNSDDSSSHSEIGPDVYSVYIDDSISSDVDGQKHITERLGDDQQHFVEFPSDTPSNSENSFNIFSIVKIE